MPVILVLLAALPIFADPVDEVMQLSQIERTEYEKTIIGGVPATIEEFPFLVHLSGEYVNVNDNTTSTSKCGGTIITEDWVMTAAHCLHMFNDSSRHFRRFYFRGGSTNRKRGGVVRNGTKIVALNWATDDIALVKVDKPWPLNGITISLAPLPQQDDPLPVGSTATIMGWGSTEKRLAPDELRKQEVVVISDFFCWVSWMWTLIFNVDAHICTRSDPEKTPAHINEGDSGCPVLVNGEVLGIASWSLRALALPDTHVRVSYYIDWIEDTVGPLPRDK